MDTPEERLQKVEESVGFVERTSEQLADEVRALGKAIGELQRRIDALERRLEQMATAPGPGETSDDEA